MLAMPYAQVAIARASRRRADGARHPGHIYIVSTAMSVARGAHFFDVWFQPGLSPLPILHGEYMGRLPNYLINQSRVDRRVLPQAMVASPMLLPVMQWLGHDYDLCYYFSNFGGFVDCYFSRAGMGPAEFYHLHVHDITDYLDWWRATDYVPVDLVRDFAWVQAPPPQAPPPQVPPPPQVAPPPAPHLL